MSIATAKRLIPKYSIDQASIPVWAEMNWAEIVIVVLNKHSHMMVSFQLNFIVLIVLVFHFFLLKKSYFIKTNIIIKKSNEKKHKPIKLKMVSPISWVLKLAEVKITNAIHNEAIDTRNKNQEKYLFITKVVKLLNV